MSRSLDEGNDETRQLHYLARRAWQFHKGDADRSIAKIAIKELHSWCGWHLPEF
jgi:hypothetical protein